MRRISYAWLAVCGGLRFPFVDNRGDDFVTQHPTPTAHTCRRRKAFLQQGDEPCRCPRSQISTCTTHDSMDPCQGIYHLIGIPILESKWFVYSGQAAKPRCCMQCFSFSRSRSTHVLFLPHWVARRICILSYTMTSIDVQYNPGTKLCSQQIIYSFPHILRLTNSFQWKAT